MSQQTLYLLFAVSLVVCMLSLFFIVRSAKQMKAVKHQKQAQEKQVEENYQKRRDYLIESIQVIAQAVGRDEKLSYTEACIRLSTLIQMLAPSLLQEPELNVLLLVHERTSHIPLKDEWKSLKKQERWKFQKEMHKIEKEYAELIEAAAKHLSTYDFKMLIH